MDGREARSLSDRGAHSSHTELRTAELRSSPRLAPPCTHSASRLCPFRALPAGADPVAAQRRDRQEAGKRGWETGNWRRAQRDAHRCGDASAACIARASSMRPKACSRGVGNQAVCVTGQQTSMPESSCDYGCGKVEKRAERKQKREKEARRARQRRATEQRRLAIEIGFRLPSPAPPRCSDALSVLCHLRARSLLCSSLLSRDDSTPTLRRQRRLWLERGCCCSGQAERSGGRHCCRGPCSRRCCWLCGRCRREPFPRWLFVVRAQPSQQRKDRSTDGRSGCAGEKHRRTESAASRARCGCCSCGPCFGGARDCSDERSSGRSACSSEQERAQASKEGSG